VFWVCFFECVETVDTPCVCVAELVSVVPAHHFAGVVVFVSWASGVYVVFDGDGVAFVEGITYLSNRFRSFFSPVRGVVFSGDILCRGWF